MAVNQRVNFPFGDAFIVGTPALDRFSQQMYVEEKQRQLLRQKQQSDLDNEFAKNMANVRDADVPKISKAYGDWKLASQAAMSQKHGVSPGEQLDLLRKKAEIYRQINRSKGGLSEDNDWSKSFAAHPELFADNAYYLMSQRRRTPIDELSQYKDANGNVIDLSDFNNFRYKGTNTDFQKILNTAYGTPKQVYQAEEPVNKDNLQTKITPYLYGNTPAQVKDSIMQSLAQRVAGRDAAALISSVDPAVLYAIDKQFKEISTERLKRMGIDKPQDLSIDKATSKAEQFAIHQAQLYALNNEPKQGTPVFRTNESEKLKRTQAQQIYLEGLRQKNRIELIGEQEKAKSLGDKANEVWIDNYIDKLSQEATESGRDKIQYTDKGSKTFEAILPMDAVLSKALEKQKVQPSELTITADGRFRPIYYKHDATGNPIKGDDGGFKVDTELSIPISRDQLKLSLGAKSVSPTQRTNEMLNKSTTPIPSIPIHTKDEFKAAGWTDEQVDKAVKAGKIKLK